MIGLARARLLMVAFVGLWAIVEALPAHLFRYYSPYQVVWSRYAVHLLYMIAVWGWRGPASLWRTRRPGFQLARSMLMLGMPASWAIAAGMGMPSGTLMTVFWLSPLLVVVFAIVGLRERPAALVWWVTGLGFGGAGLVLHPGPWPAFLELVFPLGMALTFSLYVAMTRSLRSETMQANLFYTALGVFLMLTPLMPKVWVTPPLHDELIFVGVGLVGFAALWALDRLAAAAPVSLTAPLLYLQVVFTVVISVISGHGALGKLALAGLGCILLAGTIAWFNVRRLHSAKTA